MDEPTLVVRSLRTVYLVPQITQYLGESSLQFSTDLSVDWPDELNRPVVLVRIWLLVTLGVVLPQD